MSSNEIITLGGVPQAGTPVALQSLLRETGRDMVCVTTHDRHLAVLQEGMRFFAPAIPVLTLPAWDCLPYDRISPRADIMAERIGTLHALCTPSAAPRLVLTTVNAALQKMPPREVMKEAGFTIQAGAEYARDGLIEKLVYLGYHRTGKVAEPGEFAVRGSILDVFASGQKEGVRIDFFGNEIESLRLFDPLLQTTTGRAEQATFLAVSEILLTEDRVARFREQYRAAFGAITKEDPLYEAISSLRRYVGAEHWLPLFYPHLESVLEYLPAAAIVLDYQAQEAMEEREALTKDYYEARQHAPVTSQAPKYNALPPEQLYLSTQQWQLLRSHHPTFSLSPFAASGQKIKAQAFSAGESFVTARKQGGSALYDQLKEAARNHAHTVVACFSTGSVARVRHILDEHQIANGEIHSWEQHKQLGPGAVGVTQLPLETGFKSEDTLLISEQDLFGERIARAPRKQRTPEQFLAEAASFSAGELVTHREHGIGRFEGLVTLEVAGGKHDCLKLLYAEDAKLFLPVENIELISRFGSDEEGVALDRLGSAQWQARKAKLKERITLLAAELLRTAAERALKPGQELQPSPAAYDEFCARFPYPETEDQGRAIADVLEDLAKGTPMDRLVCGDVGFGKTEVALRAAFVATHAQEGRMQVALVCPTTLLARQHFKTFSERFAGMNITIRQLSRLVPAKEAKATHEGLADGSVDIVIGTHALLANQIQFARLGLLIVDEEQHFGVAQKEKLKALKADVHVLTLTATPIPRTLQLAMTGVRSLSLITTPPIDRLAVRTYVMPFDPVVIREAVLREYHRGGKTFYVAPRIQDLAELEVALREIVPEIKLTVAHGQMAPGALDKIMNTFYDGKADVLLSTAIVESGLDIPSANTMIVHRADRFGLSQLYQLRGRVGRGKVRAYAYLTLPHQKQLTDAATKRLEVMQSLDTLGAGFTLATHDMDIRGFGNLLGEEQSGHIREVGVELYQQMLEEAIAELKRPQKAAPMQESWSPQINLGLSVLIPEDYVTDLPLRLALYRRVGNLATPEELDAFAVEMADRFGPLPKEAEQLLTVVRLKQLCRMAGIERLDAGPKGAVIQFRAGAVKRPETLLHWVQKNTNYLKIRPDQRLVLMQGWENEEDKIRTLRTVVEQIGQLENAAAA